MQRELPDIDREAGDPVRHTRPARTRLVTGYDRTVRFWDTDRGIELSGPPGPERGSKGRNTGAFGDCLREGFGSDKDFRCQPYTAVPRRGTAAGQIGLDFGQ